MEHSAMIWPHKGNDSQQWNFTQEEKKTFTRLHVCNNILTDKLSKI